MTTGPLERRASGILLHPTALPSPYGIGDLGSAARGFVDFLAAAGQKVWQVLPLGPAGSGASPYQSPSSQAGNPLLVDLEALAAEGWLARSELAPLRELPRDHVDFARLTALKSGLLERAAAAFLRAGGDRREEFERFRRASQHWLDAYADFMALKDAHGGASWTEWRGERPDRERARLHQAIQFHFFRQWGELKEYARERGVRFIGDVPLYVAHDSVDVWRHRHLFDLEASGRPRTVAGVPPDYFSATGQLWGNPLYRWEVMSLDGFAWFVERMRWTLSIVDVVRIDHFRGLEAFYEVPGQARDARQGRWVAGPGERLLSALSDALGSLPFVAEDLGVITPEVVALRDRFSLAGMRVLQFAFGSADGDDPFKPHNFVPRAVAYTGTHDNDTTVGWFAGGGGVEASPEHARAERERALRYLHSDGREIHWDFIRAIEASVARTAIVPLQDVLGLGSEARFNTPASPAGNWTWRYGEGQLRDEHAERLREMASLYGR
ncbi:MAG TPA: 4-alpha-glucanotransferase [Vicinamibacteria bacterium]|nr:4-alpha-glucanotransferase [Vicinamibacteria bacterium]